MSKIRTAALYATGYLACIATFTGSAFALGYITHTGIFA